MERRLFEVGHVVKTPAAHEALIRNHRHWGTYVYRHRTGDFGECGKYDDIELTADELANGPLATSDDGKLNKWGIDTGDGRILSAYLLPDGTTKIWVITEWDRSVTTILLPSDY